MIRRLLLAVFAQTPVTVIVALFGVRYHPFFPAAGLLLVVPWIFCAVPWVILGQWPWPLYRQSPR
jgi:Mn2+/Fe2+ NRAMP family transporter